MFLILCAWCIKSLHINPNFAAFIRRVEFIFSRYVLNIQLCMLRFIGYIRFLQWYYQDVMENEQILINIKVMTQFAADAVYKGKHSPPFYFRTFRPR